MAGLPQAGHDDFVFTLGDDENAGAQSKYGSSEDSNGTQSKKRRREAVSTNGNDPLPKKRQRRQPSKTQSKSYHLWANDQSDDSEEQQKEENDDALDPDFEFEITGLVDHGVVEEFDVWADERHSIEAAGAGNGTSKIKQGIGVDEIVARRRAAKSNGKERGGFASEDENSEADSGNEDEDPLDEDTDEPEKSDFPNFEDDELLALDGFGAGASDMEDEEVENYQNGDHAESGKDDDDDSVASPTAHPDDMAVSESDSKESIEDSDEKARRAAFFAPEPDKPLPNSSLDSQHSSSFQSFSLSRPVIKGLSAISFTRPTAIQRKTIPIALLGKDVVGSAVTGSGKTAAFLLPIIERLLYRPRKIPTTRVAILMPTRELAVQCYAFAVKLAHFTDISFAQLVGGFSLREQEVVLKSRPDVVIATPGRFIDHMRNSASFTIDTLEILVLDEADRMLEDGFADELNEIISTIPKSRQTMLFSATMTESVDRLIRVGLNRPVRLMVDKQKSTVGTLTQEFVRLRPGREEKRVGYLLYLVKNIHTSRAIIFFRQRKEVHRVRILFSLLDLKAGELHGAMTQEQRISAVEAFRSNRTTFLLATDLASRGLDIKGVETVINYEAPQSHEIYVHRVGRTARAGKSGRACTLAAEPDRKVVKAAVKSARDQGAKIVSRVVDTHDADLWAARVEELAAEVDEVLREEKEEKQLAQVDRDVNRASNLVEHRDEIMSRPRRTWFATEREKKAAKQRNGGGGNLDADIHQKQPKKKLKLSGKEKKRLDGKREREGKGGPGGGGGGTWRKSKGSEEAVERDRRERKSKQKQQQQKKQSKQSKQSKQKSKKR